MSIFNKLFFSLQKNPMQVKSKHKRIKKIKCPHCRGCGQIMEFVDDGLGVSYSSGSAVGGGRYESRVCPKCHGAGYISPDY